MNSSAEKYSKIEASFKRAGREAEKHDISIQFIRQHPSTEAIDTLMQELRLFPELTALENVEIKNKITGFALKMGIALAERAVADKYLKLEDRRIGILQQVSCNHRKVLNLWWVDTLLASP